jgi:hypothetical protein
MSWFPPAFLLASGLLSLACAAWTTFLLLEVSKDVELVLAALHALARRSANHVDYRRDGARHVQRQVGQLAEVPALEHASVLLTLPATRPHLSVSRAG